MNFIPAKLIKDLAQKYGFENCGLAQAQELTADAKRLESWLNKGYHGSMSYLENNFDLRINPTLLFEGTKTIISLTLNYFPKEKLSNNSFKISKYAYGKDYHKVIKKKLKSFILELKTFYPDLDGRGVVDSAPILEKSWAVKAGLGWIGKNGNLILKSKGSFFFIAQLLINHSSDYDPPFTQNYCGNCTKCIDSCPTQAILPNKEIKANQCISYYTIELKEKFSTLTKVQLNDWLIGCDICQDVCPWNRFSKPHKTPEFEILPQILNINNSEWLNMKIESFNELFGSSALKRAGLNNIKRNFLHISQSKV